MARKLRIGVEGGLYHVITQGNDRQDIFHSPADRLKFLSLLAKQEERLPFYLYCLLPDDEPHPLADRAASRNRGKDQAERLLTGKPVSRLRFCDI